jgi:hypothetical protein
VDLSDIAPGKSETGTPAPHAITATASDTRADRTRQHRPRRQRHQHDRASVIAAQTFLY